MAVITPNTDIVLLKCPLAISEDHQLTFSSKEEQFNYFSSLDHYRVEKYTYQRKDDTCNIEIPFDEALKYDYVMYRNTSYGDKWFYAYVADCRYTSDYVTTFAFKTDVFQTWQFDFVYHQCFIEREHVQDDTFGRHTIPEGLEYGEYIVNETAEYKPFNSPTDCYVVVQLSDLTDEVAQSGVAEFGNKIYGGIPSGTWLLAVNYTEPSNLSNLCRTFDNAGKGNAIVAMYLVPKSLFSGNIITWSFNGNPGFDAIVVPPSTSVSTLGTAFWTRNSTLNGYKPRNNKMLCSPYNYLLVTNNGGSDISFAWEDFSSSRANFSCIGVPTQGASVKLVPTNYKNTTNANSGYEWSITSQNLPIVSWDSDYYLNWQAVNGKNVEIQAGISAFSWGANMIGSMLGGGVGGMISATSGLVSQTASLMQQVRQAEMTPDQAKGNTASGDLNFSYGKSCFTGYKMSIKSEYAKMIDDYFTMYGYKVNTVKLPQITGRRNWNHVKTVGCNVTGHMPQSELQEYKDMLNRGVTFWHNSSTFLNYTADNSII